MTVLHPLIDLKFRLSRSTGTRYWSLVPEPSFSTWMWSIWRYFAHLFSKRVRIPVHRGGTTPQPSLEVCQWMSENYPGCRIGPVLRPQAYLTWVHIIYAGVYDNRSLYGYCSYRERKPCAEFSKSQAKSRICRRLRSLASFLLTQSWVSCSWTWPSFGAPQLKRLLIAPVLVSSYTQTVWLK
jgi:hypothetical protein